MTRTQQLCDGTNDSNLGPICGRPLALSFNYRTSDLYITDAFFGLLVVGFNGGLATQLSGGGPTVGIDQHHVLVPEYLNNSIKRYWLQGLKIGTNEAFLTNCGSVKNIKRAVNAGEYWVATMLLSEAQALRVNESAKVLQTVSLTQFMNVTVTVVQENNNALYVGSSHTNFVGNYTN
ncbi:strictosidine synthase-like 12-like protein [Tanacetum coccineum]